MRNAPPCSSVRLYAMDNPRPLPSVWRERSPRTKRAMSSSAGMFSSYFEMFLNVIETVFSSAAL